MIKEGDELNYIALAECIQSPAKLRRHRAYNQHIIDYLSAKLHGGVSLTQAMSDPKMALRLVAQAMKPRPPMFRLDGC